MEETNLVNETEEKPSYVEPKAEKNPETEPILVSQSSVRSIASLKNEQAMQICGFGTYQWLCLFFISLALASDGVEIFLIGIILPSARRDLCMTTEMEGWLTVALFFGMIIGAIVWGLKGDQTGRRATLLISMTVSVLGSTACVFAPTYWSFVLCRWIIGVGLGGAVPLVLAYTGELCPKEGRGFHITFTTAAWAFGGVYSAFAAFIMIPDLSVSIMESSTSFHMSGWRYLLLVCLAPGIMSVVGIYMFKESAIFLLERGDYEEALEIYLKIYAWNNPRKPLELARDDLKEIICHDEELLQMDKAFSEYHIHHGCRAAWHQITELFSPRLRKTSVIVILQWFTLLASIYGISAWYPTYLISIEESLEKPNITTQKSVTKTGIEVTGLLRRIRYENSDFTKVKFSNLEFDMVTFEQCSFSNCVFDSTRSTKTKFLGCKFKNVTFKNTDFSNYTSFKVPTFEKCNFENSQTCNIDFGRKYDVQKVYFEDLLGNLCYIPSIFIHGVLADLLGRSRLQFVTSLIASIATLGFWVLDDTEAGVVIAYCIFAAAIMMPQNGLAILTIEMFPTHLRSTGNGIGIMAARVSTISILLFFTYFINLNRAVPIIFTAALLFITALSSLALPESKNWLI